MFEPANEPQSIGGVLDTGFKLFRAGFKQIVPIAYLGSIISALWGWYFQTAMLRRLEAGDPSGFGFQFSDLIGMLIVMVLVAAFFAATLIRASNVYRGEPGSLGAALTGGIRRAPSVFVASLLYFVVMLIGLVLLIIPGVWLSISLAMCFYAAAADGRGPIDSLNYSYELVKGNWWRTAAVFGVIMIIAMVFYFALGFISAMVILSGDPSSLQQPSILLDVIIFPIVTAAITALMYCLAYVVYEDLKLRREGGDQIGRAHV